MPVPFFLGSLPPRLTESSPMCWVNFQQVVACFLQLSFFHCSAEHCLLSLFSALAKRIKPFIVNKTNQRSHTRHKHISCSSCIPKLSVNFRFIRSNQLLLRDPSSPLPHQHLPGHLHRLSVLVLGCTWIQSSPLTREKGSNMGTQHRE